MRQLAERMFVTLMMDTQISPAMGIDFGIDTPDHYRALQVAVRSGATVEVLDRALGSGPELTKMIQLWAPEFEHLKWKTAYDLLTEEMLDGIHTSDDEYPCVTDN